MHLSLKKYFDSKEMPSFWIASIAKVPQPRNGKSSQKCQESPSNSLRTMPYNPVYRPLNVNRNPVTDRLLLFPSSDWSKNNVPSSRQYLTIQSPQKYLALSLNREALGSRGICPEQQQEESSHGAQTPVAADDSAETDADEAGESAKPGQWRGVGKGVPNSRKKERIIF